MSASTRKIGLACAARLINGADEKHCGHGQPGQWDTNDLADFVQGIIESAVISLADLRPENVREFHEDASARHIVHEFVDLSS